MSTCVYPTAKELRTVTTDILKQSVVVFSKNYLPINQINIKRAIILLVSGKAEPLEFFDTRQIAVHSPNMVLFVPEHIRLKINHIEKSWKVPSVTRREILRRDKYSCQYCGSTKQLTLDHVIPLSKGGKHTWDNVVVACEPCNNSKGARTPQQAGLSLCNKPKAPSHPIINFADHFWKEHKAQFKTKN